MSIALPLDPRESALLRLIRIGAVVVITLIAVAVSHLLLRAALGRIRAGGGLTRFFRYQLAALGFGVAVGLCFAPGAPVVRFTDEKGRDRWVRHLVQQGPSMQGALSQVVYDPHHPERVMRFAITRQLFDIRPPRRRGEEHQHRSEHPF